MPFESDQFLRDDAIDDLFLKFASLFERLITNGGLSRADVNDIINKRVSIPIDGVVFPPFPPDRPRTEFEPLEPR